MTPEEEIKTLRNIVRVNDYLRWATELEDQRSALLVKEKERDARLEFLERGIYRDFGPQQRRLT